MADKILVFGASQRTGLEVSKLLAGRGDKLRVFVRLTSDIAALQELDVEFATGDALDADSVDAAFASGDISAVVCTLGGSRNEPRPDVEGTQNIVASALRHGVQRMVLVTAIGAGDSRAVLTDNAWKFLGPVMEMKTQAEACLTESSLQWTILRPGGMASEPATGTAIRTEDHTTMGMIQRADLAALAIECLDDAQTIGKIYHTIDPEAKEQPPLQRGVQPQPGAAKP
jgi:nucleoside-diphosphate-sugar epimerase